ncbi:MAG TPA: hypothetical protein VGP84_01315, partial [Gemmatimonadaceae bacterium]|nr:hypothetical protein [Gemmatimonadaceae bacterium]
TGKGVPAHRRAQALGNVARRGSRSAKQRYELVSTRMGEQLTLSQIRPSKIEDRAQHRIGVRLTKFVREPSVVIDVSDEQGDGTTRDTGLGNRCRGGIDERVVGREPSLLIEKNGLLLPAGRNRTADPSKRGGTTVRAGDGMTQEKRGDLCHIAFKWVAFRALSRS